LIIWVDAQLSPALAPWLTREFSVQAVSVRQLGLRGAKDRAIFNAAREANVVVMTKDADFPLLLQQLGPPPAVIWVRCGNTSNAYLRQLLRQAFPTAMAMIDAGEALVEIVDPK
jgi:predicted nuclease of predicted toxin-antitoxin system